MKTSVRVLLVSLFFLSASLKVVAISFPVGGDLL